MLSGSGGLKGTHFAVASTHGALASGITAQYLHGQRHLLDDSVVEECCTSSHNSLQGLNLKYYTVHSVYLNI